MLPSLAEASINRIICALTSHPLTSPIFFSPMRIYKRRQIARPSLIPSIIPQYFLEKW